MTVPVSVLTAVAVELFKTKLIDEVAVAPLLDAAAPAAAASAAPVLLLLALAWLLSCVAVEVSLAWAPGPVWLTLGGGVSCANALPIASAMAAASKVFFISSSLMSCSSSARNAGARTHIASLMPPVLSC